MKHKNSDGVGCYTLVSVAFSTLCLKSNTLDFDYNCGKCRPIFNFFSLSDSQENSLCNYCTFHLTLTVLLPYFVKLENYSCCLFGVLYCMRIS